MCDNCGCGHVESFKIIPMQEGGAPAIPHKPANSAHQGVGDSAPQAPAKFLPLESPPKAHGSVLRTVPLNLPVLQKNDRLAEHNRRLLKANGVLALNLVSSPGSGKTTFLAKTLELLPADLQAAVIVGDLETVNDATRLRGKGAPVVQVTTGTVCHLDAEMIARGLEQLDLAGRSLLFIENVGNLVCPAAYDLGEAIRVVLISVTEGEDKPLKYPPIFQGAKLVVISKMDLLAATGLDLAALRANIQAVAPESAILETSARTDQGINAWLEFLEHALKASSGDY